MTVANTILKDQNSDKALRSLKAQRIAYSTAKRVYIIDICIILAAIAPTILVPLGVNCREPLALVAIIITLATLIIGSFPGKQTKIGAQIQERFDTRLFKLQWNNTFVGREPDISKEVELAQKYVKGDLTDWYSKEIESTLPHSIAVVLCFKCSTIWGMQQRQYYCYFLYLIIAAYYCIMIALAVSNNLGVYDVAIWLAPSLPLLLYCTNQIKIHKEVLGKYKFVDAVIGPWIVAFKNDAKLPVEADLRSVQDLFYTIRVVPAKIPDWFYYFFKKRSNNITDLTIRAIVEDFHL
jgi:hypothetical protein